MKIAEIKRKSDRDLQNSLQEAREKLRQLRFDLAAGKVKNIREIREVKKNIAKILTVLNLKKNA
jgi:large subunit ribosomal protein L29